jgi:pimeloyl-ACP methyl ester carboxylesterase
VNGSVTLRRKMFAVQTGGRSAVVACMVRPGPRTAAVYLHGLGATKEDFADARFSSAFDGRALLAWDSPGSGETVLPAGESVDIDVLVDTAEAVLANCAVERLHLIGHSMGGLVALLLAERLRDRVISFTSIEGNLAPSDCFLSRTVSKQINSDAQVNLEMLGTLAWGLESRASALYASRLRATMQAGAVQSLCASIVNLSDRGALLERYLRLRTRRLFVHGSENEKLQYLNTLKQGGVRVAKIDHSGHFPMYSNPSVLWNKIGDFVAASDQEGTTNA